MSYQADTMTQAEIDAAAPKSDGSQDLRRFSICIEVTDAQALFDGAVRKLERGGVETDDAIAAMRLPDGRIDVNACLVQLLDPVVSPYGLQIMDSDAQRETQ